MLSTPSRSDARIPTRTSSRHRSGSPRRSRLLAAAALASGALALAVSGCTGSSAPSANPAAQTGASASGGSGGASSYADSSAVISALNNSGQSCTAVSGAGGTTLSAPGLRSVSTCSLGSAAAGGTVTAAVFDDHTDAEAYAEMLATAQSSGLLIGSGSARAVLGRNWVALVDGTAAASRLGSALGGTVVGGSSPTG